MRIIGILLITIILGSGLVMLTESTASENGEGKVVAEGKLLLQASTVKAFQDQRKKFESGIRPLLSSDQYLKTVDSTGMLVKFMDENISKGKPEVVFPTELQVKFISDLAYIEQKDSKDRESNRTFYRFLGISIGLAFGLVCLGLAEFEDFRAVRSIADLPPRARRRSLAGALGALAQMYREKLAEMDAYANQALAMTMKYNRLRIQAEKRAAPGQRWEQGPDGRFEVRPKTPSWNSPATEAVTSSPYVPMVETAPPLEPAALADLNFSFSLDSDLEDRPAFPTSDTDIETDEPTPVSILGGEKTEPTEGDLKLSPVEPAQEETNAEVVAPVEIVNEEPVVNSTPAEKAVAPEEKEPMQPSAPQETAFSAHMEAFANRRSSLSAIKGKPGFRTLKELKGYPETLIVVIQPNPEDVERLINIFGVARAQAAYDRIFDSLARVMVFDHNVAFEDGVIYWYIPKAVFNSSSTRVSLEEFQGLLDYELKEVDFNNGDPIFTDIEISFSQL